MEITRIKTQWPERAGFQLTRQDTGNEEIFIHFLTPAAVTLPKGEERAEQGSWIFYEKHSFQKFRAVDLPLLHDWFHVSCGPDALMEGYGLRYGTLYHAADSHSVTGILQRMEQEVLKSGPYAGRLCELKLEELLIILARSQVPGEAASRMDAALQRQLYQLRTKVHAAYQQEWTVGRMAALACMSESHFAHLYRQLFGISPKQDLLETRIEHAKNLLGMREFTVEQTAELCGFTNPYHFIRQFKARAGMTPGRYAAACNSR